MKPSCDLCGTKSDLEDLYDYTICNSCKSDLRLFADKSIKRFMTKNKDLEKEMKGRLEFLDKDYIKKRIKLLHVLERMAQL